MNKLGDTIGKICEVLLPIPEEFYIGNDNSSICICTLSSIKLLKENKLALIPGEYFLGNHTEYVRISYAAPIQVLEQAMNRLEAFLSNM